MIQNLLYEKLKDSLIKAKRSEICKVEDIYLWNDYKALSEYIKKCDKVPFIYSVLEQENKKIIKEGYHFYNRVGYILSNIKCFLKFTVLRCSWVRDNISYIFYTC